MLRNKIIILLFAGSAALAHAGGFPQTDAAFSGQLGQIQSILAAQSSILNHQISVRSNKKDVYQQILVDLAGSNIPPLFAYASLFDPRTRIISKIVDRFNQPAEKLPYEEYRKLFITPDNIALGSQFYQSHQVLLAQIEKQYGVDPLVLISLVGVETRWGQYAGTFPVISALYTIAARLPVLSDWACKELAEYIKLCYKGSIDPQSISGSYAGAFGYYQFMPSSYNIYAVDFDGDGKKKYNDWPDVLASVANYLQAHGYKAGDDSPNSPIWKSLYSYNPSDNYVQVILELRQTIRAALGTSAPTLP